jgi:hypothetical protein
VEEGVVVLSIDLANTRKEGRNIYILTAEETSKKFGVGVCPQGPHHEHGGANAFFVEEKRKDMHSIPSYGSWHINALELQATCKI